MPRKIKPIMYSKGRLGTNREDGRAPDLPLFGEDFAYPDWVAPIIPGQSSIGEGTGIATAEHSHPWWIYEYDGTPDDTALVATGDFTQEELDSAQGALLFFDSTGNVLWVRKSNGTWRSEVM